MGYSKNRNVFLRVQTQLDILLKLEGDEIFIPSTTPRETIYALREGINYSSEHNLPEYNKIKELFILKELKEGILIKRRKQINFQTPIQQLAKSQHLVVENATNLMEVLGALIKHKAPEMEFPKAIVKGDALLRLESWANKNNYIIKQSEPHILMVKNTDAEEANRVIEV